MPFNMKNYCGQELSESHRDGAFVRSAPAATSRSFRHAVERGRRSHASNTSGRISAPGESSRSDPIRVFIADDLVAYRTAFVTLLEREGDFHVVAQVESVSGARRALSGLRIPIDVALICMRLPDGPGTDVVPDLHAISPSCHVVMLRAHWNDRDDALAVAAGAAALHRRSASFSEIVDGLHALRRGELLIPQDQRIAYLQTALAYETEHHTALSALSKLTPREWDILRALANGKSDKKTAEEWGISRKTVAAHMANLLDKLGVESRLQAVLLALRHGVVDLD